MSSDCTAVLLWLLLTKRALAVSASITQSETPKYAATATATRSSRSSSTATCVGFLSTSFLEEFSVRLKHFSSLQILVVCLEESLFMHNLVDMKVLHTIRDTPPNPHGILALSYPKTHGDMYIAYPGSSQTGEVQIFDCSNLVCTSCGSHVKNFNRTDIELTQVPFLVWF